MQCFFEKIALHENWTEVGIQLTQFSSACMSMRENLILVEDVSVHCSGNHKCTVYYQILQGSQNIWILEEFCFYIFKISYIFLCFKTRMIRCLEAEGSPIVGWDFFRIGLSIAVCLVVGRPFATWAIKARMNTVWKAQLISKPYARVRLCLKKKWEKALEIMTNPFYFTRARTARDMDGTLHTDFWKSENSREIKHLNIFKSTDYGRPERK